MAKKIIFFLLAIIGLFLLSTFKTIWIDETYFAEITYQLLKGNGFYNQASFVAEEGTPIYIYGPMYFILTSIVVKLSALDPFWFRLTNYLAYCGVVLVMMNYFTKRKLNKWLYLLPILLLLDPSAFENAVSGRMEAVCLLFALLAYFKYFSESSNQTLKYAATGLFLSLSYLTTPRSVILFIPLGILILKDLITKRNYSSFATLAILFLTPIFIWIYSSAGSIEDYINIYVSGKKFHSGDKTAAQAYLMGGFHLNAFKIVLYGLLIVSYFIPKTLTQEQKQLNYSFSFIAFLFLFLVKDVGSYFAYISPLIAFIIFLNFQNSKFKLSHLALIGLAGFNILIFGLKIGYNIINQNKTYQPIEELVEQHIPEGTRVITDYEFYYPLRKKNLDLYYLQFGRDPQTRIQYYLDHVDPEYVLTTTSEVKMKMFKPRYNYEIIGEYPTVSPHPWVSSFFIKLGNFFRLDYSNLVIYKLTPKSHP